MERMVKERRTKARLGSPPFRGALAEVYGEVDWRIVRERQRDWPAWGSLACCLSAEAVAPIFPPSPLPWERRWPVRVVCPGALLPVGQTGGESRHPCQT